MTVGKKLLLVFLFIAGLSICLALSSLWSIGSVSDLLNITAKRTAVKLELAGNIVSDVAKMRSAQRGVVLYTSAHMSDRVETNRKLFETASADLSDALNTMAPLLDEQEKSAAASIQDAQKQYVTAFADLYTHCQANDITGALDVAKSVGSAGDQMEKGAAEIAEIQRQALAASVVQANSTSSHAKWLAVFLTSLCILAGGGVLLVVRQINRTLTEVTRELRQGSSQIACAASQVASSAQTLATAASEQASAIEETSAAGHEVSSLTRSNAERSGLASSLMEQVSESVTQSNQMLADMQTSMDQIQSSSEKISHITKLIDGIAFQTNILALNAAVESARAGEAGLGFAVVADEVRTLAQRSADAARDTARLVEESLSTSKIGSAKLSQVVSGIQSITERALNAKALVEQVRGGTEDQRTGMDQISRSITQVEHVTQKTAAQAEEEAAASEELSAQVETLDSAVVRLATLIGAH